MGEAEEGVGDEEEVGSGSRFGLWEGKEGVEVG